MRQRAHKYTENYNVSEKERLDPADDVCVGGGGQCRSVAVVVAVAACEDGEERKREKAHKNMRHGVDQGGTHTPATRAAAHGRRERRQEHARPCTCMYARWSTITRVDRCVYGRCSTAVAWNPSRAHMHTLGWARSHRKREEGAYMHKVTTGRASLHSPIHAAIRTQRLRKHKQQEGLHECARRPPPTAFCTRGHG